VTVVVDGKLPAVGNVPVYAKLSPGGGLWPLILEKAYAKLLGSYANIKGNSDLPAFRLLGWRENKVPAADPTIYGQMASCLKANGIVTVGTGLKTDAPPGWPEGLAFAHMFSVLGVRPDPDGSRWIHLYNPWGAGKGIPKSADVRPLPDGTFEMRARSFEKFFHAVELMTP
jgi:hypothetical protein